MYYVGLFSLGCFVGTLATFGLKFMTDAETWKQGLATMITATLAGSAALFVERFRTSDALGAYCVGLLIALMWTYSDVAVKNMKSTDPTSKILGWLQLTGIVLVSAMAAVLVLPTAFCEARKTCGH